MTLNDFKAGVPGVYPGIASEDYHAGPGLSKSRLDLLAQSPMHFQKGKVQEETSAMLVGTLAHAGILEGRWDLPPGVAICPEGADFRKTEWKLWEQARRLEGRTRFLKQKEWDGIQHMAEAIAGHEDASALFAAEAECELSMLANLDVTEGRAPVLLRVRHDWWPKFNSNVTADLKTCLCAHPDEFYQDVFKRGYYLSAWLYLTVASLLGLKRDLYVFVAVEKAHPYGVHLCHIERGSREWNLAETKVMKLLRDYCECRHHNRWPGYPRMGRVTFPARAYRSLEQPAPY